MEKNTEDEAVSTQKMLSSAHDPGWNDPPKWALSPTQNSCSTPVKRTLNKRVAFPLNSAPPISNYDCNQPLPPPPANMPPPPQSITLTTAPHQSLLAPSEIPSTINNTNAKLNKEETLSETLANFEIVINEHKEFEEKAEDFRKRLDTMTALWLENGLNECIHEKVLALSEALKNKDPETADKLHISLMMEYPTLCRVWIPCIRHIIQELKGKYVQSTAQEEVKCQYFQPTLTSNNSE
ncbi:steroid receptor RNA activator 1 isoform X2 [Cephus cinctus]|uniref:Steroid receptor RNA activator 1 isoform X2 n=1 Tax=Cephus cinctus TaxID=211228 RepID=A0AAJ7FUW6_CEPCN|nr:steroid receptor RNA activator 1 isoform X2 [Cephus cinctus]